MKQWSNRLERARGTRAVALALALCCPSGAAAAPFYLKEDGDTLHITNVKPAGKGWTSLDYEGRKSRRIRTPAKERDHSPERYSRYDAYFAEAAQLYGLPVALLRAVTHIESDFDPNVVSVDGAMGLMQLMPSTARRLGMEEHEYFDPRLNILFGARFLRILANHYRGDLRLTVAGYNAGPGAVDRYHDVPPFRETQRYVQRVLERYYRYRDAERG